MKNQSNKGLGGRSCEEMRRRDFVKIISALGAGCAAGPWADLLAEGGEDKARPNFIVYLSDDHGFLFSEPFGNKEVRTPNLAKLASEGVVFTHAFNASPSCGPSRTAMLTALWPARNGAEPNHIPPKRELCGLPDVLKKMGYEVAATGKVAHNNYARFYPFDFIGEPPKGAVNTEIVEKFLTSRDKSKPLCLFFGSHFPHTPWLQNESYTPSNITVPPNLADTPVMREKLADYYTSVTANDTLVGAFRDLVQNHVPGDSLFIYTADHGAQFPFGKWNLYDAGTRVPFIAVWPGKLKPGTTNDAMISLVDVMPTFIELAGGQVPDGLDGRSFAGLLRGDTTAHRDLTFTTHSGDGDFNVYPIRSVRDRQWKYILNLHPEFQYSTHINRMESNKSEGRVYWDSWVDAAKTDPAVAAVIKRFKERPAEELYDLQADPYEINNLAADPKQADRLASMRALLKGWMAEQGDKQQVFGIPVMIGEDAPPVKSRGGKKKGDDENAT